MSTQETSTKVDNYDTLIDNFDLKNCPQSTLFDIMEKIKYELAQLQQKHSQIITEDKVQQFLDQLTSTLEQSLQLNPTTTQQRIETVRTFFHPFINNTPKISSITQVEYTIAQTINSIFDSNDQDTQLDQNPQSLVLS